MKRPDTIKSHLEACEAALAKGNDHLFEGWHLTFLRVARRDFDRTGDLNESQFVTLERIRHRVDPPKLGRAHEKLTPQVDPPPTSGFWESPPGKDYLKRLNELYPPRA
jgi:hypothetical protein